MAEKPKGNEAEPKAGKPLSTKHQQFVNLYLELWNQTEAYKRVYPKSSDSAARRNASRLMTNDDISKEIDRRINELAMTANEALIRIAAVGRADLGPWIGDDGEVDIAKMKTEKATKFIKKVKRTVRSGVNKDGSEWSVVTGEVELYSALEANKFIVEIHKSGPTGTAKDPIHIKHIKEVRPSDDSASE